MAKNKALKLDWKMAGAAAGVLWCIHKIRKGVNGAIKGIGAAKKYYVYAGYYENYISSEPMPEPYVLRKTFRDIDSAIDFADSFGDEIIYCDNVKYDLPDYLYEALQDEDYDFFKYSGVGRLSLSIPLSVCNKAKNLFDAYDRAVEIERDQDAKADAIYDDFQSRGINPFADENERVVVDALYRAGLTDENGNTDVMMNRHNAKMELINYIIDNIIPYFPISASDRKLFKETKNVVYQNRLLDITRDFIDKTLEHYRNIREILNY